MLGLIHYRCFSSDSDLIRVVMDSVIVTYSGTVTG